MTSEIKIPNCRMVSGRIFKTPGYRKISDPRFRVLFAAITTATDVYGNILADPAQLADLAPSEELTPEDVEQALDEFHANRLAFRYAAGVNTYLHVMNTFNRTIEKPSYPLPPGLRAVKGSDKGRFAKHDILDDNNHMCDVDGDPLDGQEPRTAPDGFCAYLMQHDASSMQHVATCCAHGALKERNRNEMNIPFPDGKGGLDTAATAPPASAPAPAKRKTIEERQAELLDRMNYTSTSTPTGTN